MIEWATRRRIGFSAVASIGDQVDIDSADLLDFFALDQRTRAILLYIESVKESRKFMSAARAAALHETAPPDWAALTGDWQDGRHPCGAPVIAAS